MKVTINGAEYGLQWGLGALQIASDELDVSQEMILDSLFLKSREQQKSVVNLVLAGIRNWGLCQTPQVHIELTYWQLLAFASDSEQGVWDSILDDFLKSKLHGQTILEALGLDITPEVVEGAPVAKKKSKQSVTK